MIHIGAWAILVFGAQRFMTRQACEVAHEYWNLISEKNMLCAYSQDSVEGARKDVCRARLTSSMRKQEPLANVKSWLKDWVGSRLPALQPDLETSFKSIEVMLEPHACSMIELDDAIRELKGASTLLGDVFLAWPHGKQLYKEAVAVKDAKARHICIRYWTFSCYTAYCVPFCIEYASV